MKKREYFNYANEKFSPIRDPMRRLMTAYGEAERHFAHIKEIVWAEMGFVALSQYIHSLEHIQPEYVDELKAFLAEYGLLLEYPTVTELAEPMDDLDKVFEVCVGIVDETDDALRAFIKVVDEQTPELSVIARNLETLQMKNSKDRTFILEAWSMWDNNPSCTSFDNWVEHNAPALQK